MKACSFDNNEEASHAQASGQLRFVLSPRKRAEELLRTIRNASASHLKRMYLTMEILRPCKNASQTTQVRCLSSMRHCPKMDLVLYCRGKIREGQAKSEPVRNRLPPATPHQCSGLEKLHGTKIGCTANCTATKPKSSTICLSRMFPGSPSVSAIFCTEKKRRRREGKSMVEKWEVREHI